MKRLYRENECTQVGEVITEEETVSWWAEDTNKGTTIN